MEVQVTFSERPANKETLIVQKKIGEGKFGVYRVYCPLRRTYYALKIFPKDSFGASQYKKEKLMFNLKHDNVIKHVPSICHIENHYSLMTEFVLHGDFFDIVTKGLLTTEILMRSYFHQLIEGLEYIHSQGIAHLDLKLENIMLGSDFKLKLIDFDQAQSTSDKRITSGGTISYRAPEVKDGTCSQLTAADVFSAGIMLFSFKAREFPFSEKDDPACKDIKCYSTFVKNNNRFWTGKAELKKDRSFFTQDFIDLVNGMLHKDPSKRFKVKEIKASRWFNGPVLDEESLKDEMKMRLEALLKK